ncbi:Rho GTPase-activating protein 1 [Heracleum sosnowskyi]|uniref:Rho GTPase-activating protein 1 n=1 Tax=Heracleum sosnowskyi TaxID=360622 RepID=A0AAD8IQ72_9APIA|nr:Rho GTPase-activating protein 1 [Heracleum sosnowskyi]
MTDIIVQSSPSHISSPLSSIPISDNDVFHQHTSSFSAVDLYRVEEEESVFRERKRREREEGDQLSLLGVWFTVFRKSFIGCESSESVIESMEIGVPRNVRHVAHVTFDRFNGFLGLPVEFEPEVPRRPPSASTSVFGVSTKSMQLSFDSRGNSVPTILLMMQRRLYLQGGLEAEGIFRINGENSQEEYIREELNRGVVPENIDVHCLAGLIKAWFRELPSGILDSLSPEEVMQAQTEEECARLVTLLPSTESALLDWAINLMADVAQLENFNKMTARNVAMVFAPNMTQMADPLTALMYAVQVMNFLKTLIEKTLKDREDFVADAGLSHLEPSDENGHSSFSQPTIIEVNETDEEEEVFISKEAFQKTPAHPSQGDSFTIKETHGSVSSTEDIIPPGNCHLTDDCPNESPSQVDTKSDTCEDDDNTISTKGTPLNMSKTRHGQSSNSSFKRWSRKNYERPLVSEAADKSRGSTIVSRLNSRVERVEAWR